MRFATGFNGYSVKFSPFIDGRIAVATAQNFGIVGNGRQHVLETTPQGLVERIAFDTADGVYDCAWSEENENVLVAASGDGSLKLYDLAAPPQANPLRSMKEHTRECCSVHWNLTKRDCFVSSSWDDTIKLWSVSQPTSLRTFTGHTYCVYQAVWNPSAPDVLMSASGDMTVRIWDVRQMQPSLVMRPHAFEVLTADWCKYNDCIIATGSVDKTIKIWDVRFPDREMATLFGHNYAVRRVMFSPHSETLLASCSYDMTVKLWDTAQPSDPLRGSWDHHTEFAVGIDWSMLQDGLLASCGWDGQVAVWHQAAGP